ncbi:cytochrome P450 [Hyaloraphidium curvatum]|nr:cytochrome P450 [Hyaloraphidium curvatum]
MMRRTSRWDPGCGKSCWETSANTETAPHSSAMLVLGMEPATLVLCGLLLAIVALVVLAVLYPDRAAFSKSMPGTASAPGAIPVFGHTFVLAKYQPILHDLTEEWDEQLGEAVRLNAWLPGITQQDIVVLTNVKDVEFILRDPYTFPKGPEADVLLGDFMGHGIFVSDGDAWKVQRKVTSNIFNVKSFRDVFSPIFMHDSEIVRGHLATVAARTKEHPETFIDIQDLLLRSTMDSFVKLSMGSDPGNLGSPGRFDPDGGYRFPDIPFTIAFDGMNRIAVDRSINPLWRISHRLNGTHDRNQRYRRVIREYAQKIIDKKRESRAKGGPSKAEGERNDLLDFFMDVKNDDGSDLSDEQLQDTVLAMIIAGRDTTAQTMSWVTYNLSANPKIAAKMRAEMDAVLGPDKNKLPVYADLANLKYTLAVFLETLRLWSNVPMNLKTASHPVVLPGTGTTVYPGQRLSFSTFAMGRSKRIWGPDAKEFRPERWIDEQGKLKREDSFKYPAFNAGPRICLGMDMAKQEAMVLMCALFRRFDLQVVRENDPAKWGDIERRKGRYDLQASLAVRKALDVRVVEIA